MTEMKKNSTSKPAERQGKKSGGVFARHKLLVWSGVILGVLLLTALLLTWLTFSSYRDFSAPRLAEPHHLLLRRLATELRNNRDKEEAEILLSPQEANQLLDIIRHASQFANRRKKMPPPTSFMLRYHDDGSLFFSIPASVAPEWCFGGKIYASGSLYFEKRDAEINAEIPEFRFGRADISIPGGLDTVYPSWKQRMTRMLPAQFMTSVRYIRAKRDGTIVLVYRPKELHRPLKKRLSKIESRCTGELKLPLGQLIKSL